MPDPYTPASPDKQVVRVRVMDAQVDLTSWTQYSFRSHMLRPTEGWSCTIGDGNLGRREREALSVGARVRLYVDRAPLAEGFIDQVEIQADRSSGITYSIQGRNRLGLAVDAGADPTLQFKEGVTLFEVLKTVFEPFGWTSEEHFVVDNAVNRDAKTGGIRGIPTTKGGKKKGPRPLKSFVLHQLKPKDHEGVYDFAKRLAERHGLMIWCTADGEQLVVSAPDFEQTPYFQLRRTFDGGTNVLAGTVAFDGTDQPSLIVADGFSSSTEFGKSPIKAVCVNPYFGVDKDGFVTDEVSSVLSHYSDVPQVTMTVQPYTRRSIGAPMRPVFMHDNESKTQEQLENFVRRQMSLLLRKSLVAHYTVEGHAQHLEGGAVAFWDVDTVVQVKDEVAGIDERMYIIGRTFEKSRSGGTRTQLELVRLHSIDLGEAAA